ncbi:uncharacterized protein CIMG_13516 [Coccidioides immitis RS]|uniref:Uncharacterized protein n=1 Tax=Coccidioides immitis (strain RS) TaxID=246410 RepID=A0A0D8JVA0_COCIM|nr:uncharacterized protein CIMG_13516 [Coccidioides immitis RS]KJF61222.1 hypothetical protein CIMG_13516 [Coccidioides immitis RS]
MIAELQEQATLIKFILERKKQNYRAKFCINSSNKFQQTNKKNKNWVKTRVIKLMQDPDETLKRQGGNLIKKTSRCKQAALLN